MSRSRAAPGGAKSHRNGGGVSRDSEGGSRTNNRDREQQADSGQWTRTQMEQTEGEGRERSRRAKERESERDGRDERGRTRRTLK